MGDLAVDVYSIYPGSVAVAAFLYFDALIVMSDIFKDKYIIEHGIKALDQEIRMKMSDV